MPPETNNHETLIHRCIEGSEQARRELYDTFAPVMFAICLRYCRDENTAKDVFQEGFIKVFRYLPDYQAKGSFEGWLRRIFVNTALEHIRKNQRLIFTEHDVEPEGEHAEPNAYKNLAYQELIQLISSLPDGYRTVFNLFVIEGYSHKEISNILNISESTSKTQLFKARRQLQNLIKHLNKR